MKLLRRRPQAGDGLDFRLIDPIYSKFVDEQLQLYGLDRKLFCKPVPAADETFFKALVPNYEQDFGISAFKFVEAAIRRYDAYDQLVSQVFGGFDRLDSVLDFASGYGRLTRVLAHKLPKDRIWVSDIYTKAIEWQVANYGVQGFFSTESPDDLRHDRTHDVVWVGSLFSHLPNGLFQRWLAKIWSFVSPRGVLAFSVHDETLLGEGEAMDATGLRFFRTSESDSLDYDIYGMSYVSEAFVADAVGKLGPNGGPRWKRFFKGLYENQDLYVIAGPEADISGLNIASTPMGGLESVAHLSNGDVEFAGWTIERTTGAALQRIRVFADGTELGQAAADQPRPDVLTKFPHAPNLPQGFRFRLSAEQARPGAILRLQLESSSRLRGLVFAEMPRAAAFTYSGWSRRPLRQKPSGLS
jgi:2-polyprenyl-3-methyl-5-hydroxy-6-metoxy-1,4-benzoquinol methylase